MWSEPATARQISALKTNGNYDGKYYSKGRAGQTIGESVRASGSAAPASKPRSGGDRAGRGQQPRLSGAPVTGSGTISPVNPAPLRAEILAAPPATPTAPVAATSHTSRHAEQVPGASGWFALFDELEERHLTAFRAKHYSHCGDDLRDEIEAWEDLRIRLNKRLVDGHVKLVAILSNAPTSAIPDPAATAWQVLNAAFPHGHEEQHLRGFLSKHYSHSGDDLRDEVKDWVKLRIRLANTKARELVDMLNDQARLASTNQPTALPAVTEQQAPKAAEPREQRARPKKPRKRPAQTRRGRTYNATVLAINPHGAVVSLDTGDRGWLHVSQLRALNGGAWVESVSDVLKPGRQMRVRGIGVTDRGQVRLALAAAAAHTPVDADVPLTPVQPVETSAADQRRGVFSRLPWGRSRKAQP